MDCCPCVEVIERLTERELEAIPGSYTIATLGLYTRLARCQLHLSIQMMQMMQIAFLASPPLKNHLQHNLKIPSLDAPSSPSMCRVYVYLLRATPPDPLTTHFVRQTQLRWRLLRRLAFVIERNKWWFCRRAPYKTVPQKGPYSVP